MPLKEHPVAPGPALSLKADDALLFVDLQPGAQAVTLQQLRPAS